MPPLSRGQLPYPTGSPDQSRTRARLSRVSHPRSTVERMPKITIEPATGDRFDDAQHALTGGGDGRSCQCQWWLLTNKDWESTSQSERERMLRTELDAGPPPALIAYVDGEPAGWVRVGPRTKQIRLGRTRN